VTLVTKDDTTDTTESTNTTFNAKHEVIFAIMVASSRETWADCDVLPHTEHSSAHDQYRRNNGS